VAIKTVKTLDIKMPYPIEMKRLMGKWRCRVNTVWKRWQDGFVTQVPIG
jgi:hypothetical protein